MAADDDTARFEDWDRVPMASGSRWHRVANGKIGIGFRWHRVANANLTIGLVSASKLSKIG
jgi:hypothetical protein